MLTVHGCDLQLGQHGHTTDMFQISGAHVSCASLVCEFSESGISEAIFTKFDSVKIIMMQFLISSLMFGNPDLVIVDGHRQLHCVT